MLSAANPTKQHLNRYIQAFQAKLMLLCVFKKRWIMKDANFTVFQDGGCHRFLLCTVYMARLWSNFVEKNFLTLHFMLFSGTLGRRCCFDTCSGSTSGLSCEGSCKQDDSLNRLKYCMWTFLSVRHWQNFDHLVRTLKRVRLGSIFNLHETCQWGLQHNPCGRGRHFASTLSPTAPRISSSSICSAPGDGSPSF